MDRNVGLELREGVAWITVDDGRVNALSEGLLHELDRALDTAEAEGAIAVLQGREGIFSAGFDMKTFARGYDPSVAMVRAGAELVLRLLAFPAPVVTVCAGHAYPMGAFLMLAADVRFAAEGDFRIGLNEVAIGITLPAFAVELARHRLPPHAFARVATGPLFPPSTARELGFVDHVLPRDALDAAVAEELQRLAAIDRASHVATKARLNARAIGAIRQALETEVIPVERPQLAG
ncbi:MAG: crotonase/enoyl-CoA hydratase family protein [Myxococcales bacterium]|nr:crotonase/enoyl-CoA hydratase family protein [Myxococcales bacterium]